MTCHYFWLCGGWLTADNVVTAGVPFAILKLCLSDARGFTLTDTPSTSVFSCLNTDKTANTAQTSELLQKMETGWIIMRKKSEKSEKTLIWIHGAKSQQPSTRNLDLWRLVLYNWIELNFTVYFVQPFINSAYDSSWRFTWSTSNCCHTHPNPDWNTSLLSLLSVFEPATLKHNVKLYFQKMQV